MTKLIRYAPRAHRSPFTVDLNRIFGDALPFEGTDEGPSNWKPLVDVAETDSLVA